MVDEIMEFKPSKGYSLGVEIEFQIIDQDRFSLVPLGPTLQDLAPEILRSRISQELIKSILEIRTGICRDLRDVENDLLQTCSLAEELAADNGCLLYAASLHPFALVDEQERSNVPRYQDILTELQIVGRRFISQGLHVHVGVSDGEAAVRVCNTLQAYLPLFLALSTSSPYFQGEDTGLMSYRTKLFEALPLAGDYELMQDWQHFAEIMATLKRYGIVDGIRDLWWDARPNPQFGTIEIQICDLPSRFRDILAIVSFVQAVVAWIVEENHSFPRLNSYLIKANKWQAARHGMGGRFVDPNGLLADDAVSIAAAVLLLLEKVTSYGLELDSIFYLEKVTNIVSEGTGADKQRLVFEQANDLREMVRICQQGFWE